MDISACSLKFFCAILDAFILKHNWLKGRMPYNTVLFSGFSLATIEWKRAPQNEFYEFERTLYPFHLLRPTFKAFWYCFKQNSIAVTYTVLSYEATFYTLLIFLLAIDIQLLEHEPIAWTKALNASESHVELCMSENDRHSSAETIVIIEDFIKQQRSVSLFIRHKLRSVSSMRFTHSASVANQSPLWNIRSHFLRHQCSTKSQSMNPANKWSYNIY